MPGYRCTTDKLRRELEEEENARKIAINMAPTLTGSTHQDTAGMKFNIVEHLEKYREEYSELIQGLKDRKQGKTELCLN